MGVAANRRKTLGEFAFEIALDGAIKTLIATIDTVRFVRKVRRRYKASRKG